jgi:hypothetical protein
LFLSLLLFLSTSLSQAAVSYSVPTGSAIYITEFGVCRWVRNNHASGSALFVPTNTALEWSTFRANPPAGVTVVSGPGCFAPTGISLWLDASDARSLFTNTTCTTNVAANGDAIACWRGMGSTISFTQATAGSRPVYSTSGGSGSLPFATFANRFLATTAINLNPRTLFVVYRDSSTAQWITPFTGAVATDGWFHGNTDNTSLMSATWTNANMRSATHYTNGTSWTFTGTPGALDNRPTAWSIINVNTSSNYGNTTGIFHVGSDRGQAGRTINGAMAEIIVYTGVLTATERQDIEGYLACKWNLQASLPGGHPYSSSCPP